jgi:predicted nucleic acid-binding protein
MVIVIDASVAVDLLLQNQPNAEAIAARLQDESIAAPHLLDVEVGQVLRRLVRARTITPQYASSALEDLAVMPIARHPHTALLVEAFSLRDNVSFYDAMYLALAAQLEAPLLTSDRAIARLRRLLVDVELID